MNQTLKEAMAQGTQGPFRARINEPEDKDKPDSIQALVDSGSVATMPDSGRPWAEEAANTILLAHCRNNLPRLLAAVKQRHITSFDRTLHATAETVTADDTAYKELQAAIEAADKVEL